jgi:hypothetical protein
MQSRSKAGENNPFYGRKHSEETLKKMRARKPSEETRKRMRENAKWQYGETNSMWKGTDVKYEALHIWVRKHLPKTQTCLVCNKTSPYDIANITGVYNRDFNNWQWLCRRCHMLSDGRMKNLKQYKTK